MMDVKKSKRKSCWVRMGLSTGGKGLELMESGSEQNRQNGGQPSDEEKGGRG